MFRKLIKTADLDVENRTYNVHYFETSTARGGRRYSSEIVVGPGDHIILDDDSLNGLESKVARLAPATVYSRMLAGRITAAA